MKTIAELAGELYDGLETARRYDDSEFIRIANTAPDWAQDVIRKTHGDSMPNNTTYDFIQRCAGQIHDSDAEDEDAAQEAIYEIEPDIYTSNLTAWLHESPAHVYYLTEAMEDGPSDGFQLLASAQLKHIQEVGLALISALVELQSKDEDEAA